jgi:hypothetical protein
VKVPDSAAQSLACNWRALPGRGWCVTIFCLALCVAEPVLAHHSFAMFDTTSRITVTGKVAVFEWTNPHAIIEIDGAEADGGSKHWTVELGSPSILLRGGWKYNDMKSGDNVIVVLNPLKSGRPGGLLVQVTLADGRVLGNGGTPPAAARGDAPR